MPYTKQDRRKVANGLIHLYFDKMDDVSVGDLNYFISRLMHSWVLEKGICYDVLNSVDGILGCAQKEFYRTVSAKYEDKKKAENGSVSILDSPK